MKGWFRKYIITKSDGTPVDPEAEYLVLRLDTDPAARVAALAYAKAIKPDNRQLSDDIVNIVHEHSDRAALQTNNPETNWQIWAEGYQATGENATATYLGEAKGRTFQEACNTFFANPKNGTPSLYNPDRRTYWGCRLFDNEAEARVSFG